MFSLDPDFLRTFLAISETGSFGAAGERVNKTQSTVSAQMKRLEEIIGVPLFEREGPRRWSASMTKRCAHSSRWP